ncbi:MAG: PAQR family membrane homeostasis protein TrhA [Anaerovoracaceae bacterium]|jgi:hemolysin III
MFRPRDKWSCITHLAGALMAAAGTIGLIFINLDQPPSRMIAMLAFGFSMIALYSCSAAYHYSRGTAKHIEHLRNLDHSMIFVLIAGTYTPIMCDALPAQIGRVFLTVLWILAGAGVIMKIFWLYAPRWLYTIIYLIMGWSILIDFRDFIMLPGAFIAALLLGGAAYTAGAVIYARKRPNPTREFGFHEIFHVLVIAGTACHYYGIVFLM